MKVISVVNRKGGVGKTTTVLELGFSMHKRGKKVLLLDLDSQGNVARYFVPNVADYDRKGKCITSVFKGLAQLRDVVIRQENAPDFVVSYNSLDTIGVTGDVLHRALESVRGSYDICILDTPPSGAGPIISALANSDYYIVPTELSDYSLAGMYQLFEWVAAVKQQNPDLECLGVLPTRYTLRATLADGMRLKELHKFASKYGVRVFQPIRDTVAFKHMLGKSVSIADVYPDNAGASGYRYLDTLVHMGLGGSVDV